MKQNELNYYELIEFLRSVYEHLLDIEDASLVIPKRLQPILKDIVHDSISDIVFMLVCIDKTFNPELFPDDSKLDVVENYDIKEQANENWAYINTCRSFNY